MSLNSSFLSPVAPLSQKEARISRIEHARLLNPFRRHVEEVAAKAAAAGKNEDAPFFDSIKMVLVEGDFALSAEERLAIDELKTDLAAIDAEILSHTRDVVKERHCADSLKGPQPPLEDVVESSRKFLRNLKQGKTERIQRFGPVAREIATRALHVIEGTWGLAHEREKDCAAAFGFAFHPSHTLNRLNCASVPFREILNACNGTYGLSNPDVILRLTDGFNAE